MGLPERKSEDQAKAPEPKSTLLDEKEIFTRKQLPYREVEFVGADGVEGSVLVQALTMQELDEINEIQNRPVLDGRGNVIEEANQIGWDAKVVARALRRPNRQRMFTEHWQAGAEQIATGWLPGTVRKVRAAVLELSGFGPAARSEEKKGS